MVDEPEQLKALGDRTRMTILDLVLERAATVTELATALGRPKSTVAHHVEVLQRAGLLRVVRTRKIRAVTEAFYGRTGRTIHTQDAFPANAEGSMLAEALHERVDTGSGRDCHWATLRHARIPSELAEEFFERVAELASEFTALPRGGDVVYGFVASVYATAHPALPPARPDEGGSR